MARHDVVIIKDTHRGLIYEDGVLKEVLPAGRHLIPRTGASWAARIGLGRPAPDREIVLVDVRRADRTVVVPDVLTADGASISASFAVQFRIVDPRAATHEVRNPGERLYGEVQTTARRLLRGSTLEEILAIRDEIGEEILYVVAESAALYGVEVSGLDLKDLALPDELRETLNRAVFAKYVRRARPIEAWGEDDMALASGDLPEPIAATASHDDSSMIFPLSHEGDEGSRFAASFAAEGLEPNPVRYRAASE